MPWRACDVIVMGAVQTCVVPLVGYVPIDSCCPVGSSERHKACREGDTRGSVQFERSRTRRSRRVAGMWRIGCTKICERLVFVLFRSVFILKNKDKCFERLIKRPVTQHNDDVSTCDTPKRRNGMVLIHYDAWRYYVICFLGNRSI